MDHLYFVGAAIEEPDDLTSRIAPGVDQPRMGM